MRDYSFGNFISAQRKRCGLSQYQLGALVGVSDKAVSKWENGASKPKFKTIRKLSEIFDIGIDELLTCEYAAFSNKRKDLFAMKKEIIHLAENKVKEFYGDNPPIEIVNRFKMEEIILDGHELLLWMGFLGKLKEKLREKNAHFTIRGAQTGASFIAWLMGGTNVNPLPSHYYCPICKNVKFVPDEKCGMDLPKQKCSCGRYYQRDGFGIGEINMYPLRNYNEITVSNNATADVKSCLTDYFEGYGEVRTLNVIYDKNVHIQNKVETIVSRFVIFPKELAKKYPEEIIDIQAEEYYKLLNEWSVLMVVEDLNDHTGCRDLSEIEFTPQQLSDYLSYAVKNEKFKNPFEEINMDYILENIKEPKFCDLIALEGLIHSTGTWKDNADSLYKKGIPLDELIYCREDAYEYLYSKLNGKCCKNPFGQVYAIKEALRKGKYSRGRMPEETERLLLECEVPEWYVESMKKILYLFPKTHIIAFLKRDICKFLEINE